MPEKKPVAGVSWVAATLILVVSLLCLSPLAFSTAKWVGHTDIEIRFAITDWQSMPVSNATVHIRDEGGGFCHTEPGDFQLSTDENGEANILAKDCMCFGSSGPLENTFASHLPPWTFHASADGFAPSKPNHLEASENVHRVQRGDPHATLEVDIQLEPDNAARNP